MADEILQIEHVNKKFNINGNDLEVLNDIDFSIKKGEFICIVGFSGCGKSTLLRMIGGLETIDDGTIRMNGEKISGPSLDRGMIFQEPRLFPWLKVKDNIAFGIPDEKRKKLSRKQVDEKVDEMLKLVELETFKDSSVNQLSGGMQQRVSIARSLIQKPDLLLLDEPFGALDAFTRINMQNSILDIWQKERRTTILVTHDIDEAIFLADRIVILSERPGKIKDIINVKLSRPRDRSNNQFFEIRKEILMNFLGGKDISIEYYI